MNKILKIRKIFIWVALGLAAITVVMSIISSANTNHFFDKVEKAGIILSRKGDTFISIAILVISQLLFWIFAVIFIFSRSQKVQNRKWPYITMIVFGSLGIVIKVIMGMVVLHAETGLVSTNIEGDKPIIQAIWEDGYKSTYSTILVVSVIVSIVILAINITHLVLIAKSNKFENIDYSNQVIKAAEAHAKDKAKQNDLP